MLLGRSAKLYQQLLRFQIRWPTYCFWTKKALFISYWSCHCRQFGMQHLPECNICQLLLGVLH